MITFIRWRAAVLAGKPVGAGTSVRGIALVSFVQTGLVVIMLFTATAVARGYGMIAD
ncbi:MAG TPA: hypothetical protein VNL18_07820 [Gemmatimonadales bacterium]|nr:hypothetical protein [Gemmatimonadales bacterium]